MSIRPSVRFDVFRRDGFCCAYCGRRPPQALLEVDHIVPRASGGGDEEENLITACFDCNRGKGAKELDAPLRPLTTVEQTEQLQERSMQAKAYAEAVQAKRDTDAQMLDVINEHWCLAFGGEATHTGWKLPQGSSLRFPSRASLLTFIKKLPLDQILEAIDITAVKLNDWQAERYFYGICWRMIKAGGAAALPQKDSE